MENLLANNVDPDQTPHHVASDLSLHCLPLPFYGFPGKNGIKLHHPSAVKAIFLQCIVMAVSFHA